MTGKTPLWVILGIISLILTFTSCEENTTTSVETNDAARDWVDLVYPQLDTENSRWFFFSSANRPFGMVNLSPDTEIHGAWGSGYRYKVDTVKGFSHIHAWQMSGLSVMPIAKPKEANSAVFGDFYSGFSHDTEKVSPGYHYLELDRYNIAVELTSTKRVGFHKYAFPESENIQSSILFNLNTQLGPCEISDGHLQKDGNMELSGSFVMQPTRRRPKPLTTYFKVRLNVPVASIERDDKTKNYLLYLDKPTRPVLMKVAISYTSVANAALNMEKELPHWNFEDVVKSSKDEWNEMLSRIQVEGASENDRRRFYTDLWHALQGRRIISDVNGAYPDNTGDQFRIGQLPLNADGNPKFNHYNSDSFWGAQWTINTLWGLVYPEIMKEFSLSMMQYYQDGGLVPRGPSGGNYTYVMTGASSTPFIVSAIQKGLIEEDLDGIYKALRKNHMPGGIMGKAGYEHNTDIGGGMAHYLEKGYVPYPLPEGRHGIHLDGSGQTLEYAYQDYTLAQLAQKLNKHEDYDYFMKRSKNYRNVFNGEEGWMAPKEASGQWKKDFDPYAYENGFVESNAAQSTWFVPHDLDGLGELMGGKGKAVEKLDQQFKKAEELNFTSGSSHESELHPEYRRIPINLGNQPSIQTPFVFNKLGRPDLTQYWTRTVVKRTFSGLAPNTGYNGDEDQGLMGSLNVLYKIGLFQMNGGTEENPEYQIGSPIFDKVTIRLNPEFYPGGQFVITANNNGENHFYSGKPVFKGEVLNDYAIKHNDIVNGGELLLNMVESPN
ncbi:GH92 family glycosyl hydrolase [Pseudozobellia thermophila]|uniref:Alpha-1,2-mannosidase, putative n=1 Tax=Pseudozobellia thermophila TaxID=192903 RepID=A0A1M6FZY4_9FLAO|nr:GH92 family glycosyl hydrolase [Pseudozobellia thermophila]SHJ03236.1 alpha-1,2-mannosidase, putative [Pseudozobellia thermophila]